ncbi:MAG: nucleotidyltransferase family protein, partial [Bacteroidetes bacterium]|nr:nucleotidyltransferase family protein [Bacteroidota bacterium]
MAAATVPIDGKDILSSFGDQYIVADKLLYLSDIHRLDHFIFTKAKEIPGILPEAATKGLRERLIQRYLVTLAQISEITKLTSLFEKSSVDHLFFKGLALSQLLYEDMSIRSSHDIDLLIRAEDVRETDRLLKNEGYTRITPEKDPGSKQFRILISKYHHFKYLCPDRRIILEIHWKTDKYGLFHP